MEDSNCFAFLNLKFFPFAIFNLASVFEISYLTLDYISAKKIWRKINFFALWNIIGMKMIECKLNYKKKRKNEEYKIIIKITYHFNCQILK